MKNAKQLFTALLLTVFGVSPIFADDENAFHEIARIENADIAYSIYAVKNVEKIRFNFEKVQSGKVIVKIYDKDLNLLHTDSRKENIGRISYNLVDLGEGTYHVKVASGDYTKTHTFKVGFPDNSDFAAYISSKTDSKKVRVSFQNAFAPVEISITDSEGVEYYEQILTQKQHNQYLNLSQLIKGSYTVSISSGGKSFSKEVELTK